MNNVMELKFAKVRDVKSPTRGTSKSAGIDFYVPNDFSGYLLPHTDILVPSGIKINIPEGYMLMGADKSGVVTSSWACKKAGRQPKSGAFDTAVIIGAKIIDEDYQGEMNIHLINTGAFPIKIEPGMKIAQFILVPVLYAEPQEVELINLYTNKTDRGDGGFGSTGSY